MPRYIDADALLKEWKIELPKKWPVKGEHSEEFLDFMKRYENHPYYFAILSLYLTEPAGVCEVVRCKDCKECEERKTANYLSFLFCKSNHHSVAENDYCSYGERREDAEIH